MEINIELARKDLDYATRAYNVRAGKTLIVPTGEFRITEVVEHLNKITLTKDGKEYHFPLATITYNLTTGKATIK